MIRMPWPLPLSVTVSLGLAVLVVLALGARPAAVPALALAAIAPELARVDLAEHRLPNRMVLPALAVAVPSLGIDGAVRGSAPLVPLLAALLVGGTLFALALVGGMGMGDVKLAALIGLASPTALTAVAAPFVGFLAGGAVSAVLLARGGRGRRIPFGPFLLLGWGTSLVLQLTLGRSD